MNQFEYERRWKAFWQMWQDVYACWGFDAPKSSDRRTQVVWEKVQEIIPCEAYPFISDILGDRDSRPRNLKKAIMGLYYEWRSKTQTERPAKDVLEHRVPQDGPIGRQLLALRKQGVPSREALGIALRQVQHGGYA